MELYIFLQAKEIHSISFKSPLTHFLEDNFEELVIYEADQLSDQIQIKTGLDLISKAQKIILHLEDDGKTSFGAISQLLEGIRKSDTELLVLSDVQNKLIEQTLKMLKSHQISQNFESAITNFLSRA